MFYIFLDFDGVLHPCTRSKGALFCHMPRFADFLRRNPGVKIVVSSSWRKTDDFQRVRPHSQLRKYFPEDLRDRVVGCTPALPRCNFDEPDTQREQEVQAWLHAKKKTDVPYAILDDSSDMFTFGLKQLVLCDSDVGFSQEVEQELQSRIDAEMKN